MSQEVGLILDRVGRQCQLHGLLRAGVPQQAGIVPRGNAVKLLLMLAAGEVLKEGTKLDPAQGDRAADCTGSCCSTTESTLGWQAAADQLLGAARSAQACWL